MLSFIGEKVLTADSNEVHNFLSFPHTGFVLYFPAIGTELAV